MKPLSPGAAFPRTSARVQAARLLRRFEPFQGFANRKISPPRIRRPADLSRSAGRMDAGGDFFWFGGRGAAVASASLERGVGFGGIPTLFLLFSMVWREEKFPPSLPADDAS